MCREMSSFPFLLKRNECLLHTLVVLSATELEPSLAFLPGENLILGKLFCKPFCGLTFSSWDTRSFLLMLNVKHTISVGSLAGLFVNSYYQESGVGAIGLGSGQTCLGKDEEHARCCWSYWFCSESSLSPEGNEKIGAQVQLSFLQ